MAPRSVVSFRQQYTEAVSVKYKLYFHVSDDFNVFSIPHPDDVIKVEFTCQKVFNMYLFRKGYSYCTYLDELPKTARLEVRIWQIQKCEQKYNSKNNQSANSMDIEDPINIGQLSGASNPMEIFIENMLNE